MRQRFSRQAKKSPVCITLVRVMHDVAKWFLQNWQAGLAIVAAVGCGVAALVTYRGHRSQTLDKTDDAAQHTALQERRTLVLLCGDAKALADLAIQRHMSDAVFLQRLRAQPCFNTLFPHFSEDFRQQITLEPGDQKGKQTLAEICRKELERLEREWFPAPAKHV